ncbi:MAG: hypothetical protein AAFO83_10805 [Cyanobacteria bacterium J06607_13]
MPNRVPQEAELQWQKPLPAWPLAVFVALRHTTSHPSSTRTPSTAGEAILQILPWADKTQYQPGHVHKMPEALS